jgi:hypothetical protein
MRTALFLVLCLAIAQAKFWFPHATAFSAVPQVQTTPTINGTLVDLDDFYNGLWAYVNLTQTEAIQCYNDVTAETYFQYLQATYDIAGAFINANRTAVALLSAQIEVLNATLFTVEQCVHGTNDYMNLLEAYGLPAFNNSLFNLVFQIYGQAHQGDWYLAFTPIYNQLAAAEYNPAGYAYGAVFQQIAANASLSNVYFEALKAYQNGIFYEVNITSPFDLSNCYNETQAQNYITFYYLWSQTVFNSTQENVVNATNAYMSGQGAQLLASIGPVNTCMEQTNDQERLNTAVGYDVHSAAFDQAITNFYTNDTATYYILFKYIYNFFEQQNPEAAGAVYGQFYLSVAASIGTISA